jgi:hypothetical protein
MRNINFKVRFRNKTISDYAGNSVVKVASLSFLDWIYIEKIK